MKSLESLHPPGLRLNTGLGRNAASRLGLRNKGTNEGDIQKRNPCSEVEKWGFYDAIRAIVLCLNMLGKGLVPESSESRSFSHLGCGLTSKQLVPPLSGSSLKSPRGS